MRNKIIKNGPNNGAGKTDGREKQGSSARMSEDDE